MIRMKCGHHEWSVKQCEMRVRYVYCMHEVGDMAGRTEKAPQGDLVLGRRFCLCPLFRWVIKYMDTAVKRKEGRRE